MTNDHLVAPLLVAAMEEVIRLRERVLLLELRQRVEQLEKKARVRK